jgi:hypothetical protein
MADALESQELMGAAVVGVVLGSQAERQHLARGITAAPDTAALEPILVLAAADAAARAGTARIT